MERVANNTNKIDINCAMREYGSSIFRICYLYLKDYSLSEDATQDTFIKVYNKSYLFNNKSSEKTWIIRIAINVCKDYLKTAWLRKIIIGINHSNDIESQNINIDNHEFIADENRDLINCISNLKPHFKEVILLYYYQKYSIEEISKIINVPKGTICSRLKRARQSLKKLLLKSSTKNEVL